MVFTLLYEAPHVHPSGSRADTTLTLTSMSDRSSSLGCVALVGTPSPRCSGHVALGLSPLLGTRPTSLQPYLRGKPDKNLCTNSYGIQ